MDDSAETVRRFIHQFQIPYTVAIPGQDSPINGTVEVLPTSFLLDRDGRVAQVYTGAVTERVLRASIDRLLAER